MILLALLPPYTSFLLLHLLLVLGDGLFCPLRDALLPSSVDEVRHVKMTRSGIVAAICPGSGPIDPNAALQLLKPGLAVMQHNFVLHRDTGFFEQLIIQAGCPVNPIMDL